MKTKTMFKMLIVLTILTSLGISTMAQVPPPDTGKMSWGLYQAAERGMRKRAAGEEVQSLSALLITKSPVSEDGLKSLAELEYTVVGALGRYVLVKAPADQYVDPEKGLVTIEFISNATLPPESIINQSEPLTSGISLLGAQEMWKLGYKGQGAKIAVIDNGFDPTDKTLAGLNPTYYLVQPTGKGVGTYKVEKGEVATESPHGTSCGIIAGDVAPESDLYLLSYPPEASIIGWLDALLYATAELKVDVVSSSVGFALPTCHADGGGILNDLVTGILEETDNTLVYSAGNWAAGSGADRTFYGDNFSDQDHDYNHDFTISEDSWDRNTLSFTGNEGDKVIIIMEWDQWELESATWDLDLILYDSRYHVPVAVSQARQYGRKGYPREMISIELPYTGEYRLAVHNRAGAEHGEDEIPGDLHLYLFNADGPLSKVEHHNTCGSVREIATNPKVISVGAMSYSNLSPRSYSSRGPTEAGVKKPDLYGPDGVTGTAYDRSYGTSAAAPYVAGAYALLRSSPLELTRDEILKLLRETAHSGSDACGNPIYQIDLRKVAEELA